MTDAQETDLQRSVMPSVTIYSDGSFKPDLGASGYGTIMTCNGHSQFLYGGFVGCSNNAMELLGPITALRMLNQPCRVTIISDSKYVVDGINNWMIHWCANGWKKADGGQIKNEALWREMYQLAQLHCIVGVWVKGHAGNFSNQICDHLACIGTYSSLGIAIPPHLIADNRL